MSGFVLKADINSALMVGLQYVVRHHRAAKALQRKFADSLDGSDLATDDPVIARTS